MKRIRTILFTFCFCAFAVFSFAQSDTSFLFLQSIKGNFSAITIDNLDNIYLINNTNQLKKIQGNGDSMGVFNDVRRFGNPSSIDVTNPLKVLLYYSNFSTVVVLDRFLEMRNSINFRKQNIFLVKSIASSYDNNIWLFDEEDYKLKKIDEEGQLLQETTSWRMLFDSVPSPTQIIDRDNYIYLYDREKGFYIFDYYGRFQNRLPFLNWNNVEVSGKFMYGFCKNVLYSYELHSLLLKEHTLPAFFAGYLAIKAMNGKLYLLKNDGLYIYQLK